MPDIHRTKVYKTSFTMFLQDVGHIYHGIILTERFFHIKDFYNRDKVISYCENNRIFFTALLVPVNRNQPMQMTINTSLLGKDFKVTDAANELLTYSLMT